MSSMKFGWHVVVVLSQQMSWDLPSQRRVQFSLAHMRQNGKSRSPLRRDSIGRFSSRRPASQ